jgi:uncharacterized membrane protein YqjE
MSLLSTGIARLMDSIEHMGAALTSQLTTRLDALRAALRAEVRRAVSAAAWAAVAAAMAIAGVGFAAAAVLIAAWDTHPVLAAGLLAAGLLVLAAAAFLAMRRCTR